jgi:hypothetical protein
VTDDNVLELIDELRTVNRHLADISGALDWFNMLQRDRYQLEQQQA